MFVVCPVPKLLYCIHDLCQSDTLVTLAIVFRLNRMHEMLTILTDVRGVSLSVSRLKSAAPHAVYAACRVRGVIRFNLRQMLLAYC